MWSKQRDILNSVFFNEKTFVRAAHSVGKTYVAAVAVLAFLFTRMPSKVITTAPTFYQVKDLLWSEIRTLYKSRLARLKGFPGEPFKTRLDVRDDWFAIGLSPREDVNMQGYHQRNVLIIVDESPGVRPKIIDALEGLMSSGDCHMLHIGNPISSADHFYSGFYKDPEVAQEAKFHVSAYDTPAFTGERVPAAVLQSLVTPKWARTRKEKWGEDSPLYQSKVLGDFPDESESQLISLKLCEEAKRREVSTEGKKVLGVDVALYGDDKTTYIMREGGAITGIWFDTKRDPMYVAGRIASLYRLEGFDRAQVDVIGIGSGVVARCKELHVPVVAVDVRERAFNYEDYFNLRTELWFEMKDWLKIGQIPENDDLVADLVAPYYEYHSDGRYKLEKKEKTKKRLGRSPDYGDAGVNATSDNPNLVLEELHMSSTSMSSDELMEQMGIGV